MKRVQKLIVDGMFSFVAFVALSPLFVAIPLLIKMTSRGPVFYRQVRLTKDGKEFKLKDDPRVTLFGRLFRKTSLDELPQLFNVFSGDMALIGPRPIVEKEIQHYGDAYKVFSSVRPGITGLWQVSGRSDTGYERRVALDAYYVLNWSPWMDLWILIRTVFAVLLMRGAR